VAELIHEHGARIRTPDGIVYVPRTYAARQSDGTWEGWLEFIPVDAQAPVLKTDRDTSQASREALATWASGLEPAYFEGAFARAHLVTAG
jgi:hypothetical protein